MTLLTPDELAQMMKLPRRTVVEMSRRPGFPPSITGRRKPRWDSEAVNQYIKSVQISHTTPIPQ